MAEIGTKLMLVVICGRKGTLRGRGNWGCNSIYNVYVLIAYRLLYCSLYVNIVRALPAYCALS